MVIWKPSRSFLALNRRTNMPEPSFLDTMKLENCIELGWKGVKSSRLGEMIVQKPSKRCSF